MEQACKRCVGALNCHFYYNTKGNTDKDYVAKLNGQLKDIEDLELRKGFLKTKGLCPFYFELAQMVSILLM